MDRRPIPRMRPDQVVEPVVIECLRRRASAGLRPSEGIQDTIAGVLRSFLLLRAGPFSRGLSGHLLHGLLGR